MRKSFKHSVGFYYQDAAQNEVIAWHNCARKPIHMTNEDHGLIKAGHNINCPKCRKSVTMWQPMQEQINDTEENDSYLRFDYISRVKIGTWDCCVNIEIDRLYFDINRENMHITAAAGCEQLCLNTADGFTYHNPDIDKTGSGHTTRKKVNKICSGIRYYRGGLPEMPPDAMIFIKDRIDDFIKQVHGNSIPRFEAYSAKLTLDNLVMYVNCPYINPAYHKRVVNKPRIIGHHYVPEELKTRCNCTDAISQVLMQSKIPFVKSMKKIAYSNPEGIPLLASISRSFQNVDLIRSLYNAYIGVTDNSSGRYIDFSARIYQKMIEERGEQITAGKLLSFIRHDKNNNAYFTLQDLSLAYDGQTGSGFAFPQNFDIDQLHLLLATEAAKKEYRNRRIIYTSEELELEKKDKMYSISLVGTTQELIYVGAAMNICVGSYAENVFRKVFLILILRNIYDSKPIGCIQVLDNIVVQVRGQYNRILEGDALEFVRTWSAEKGLRGVSC